MDESGDRAFWRFMTSLMWMGFIILLIIQIQGRFDKYMENKGIAVSNYLYEYLGARVAPEEARYLHVNVNQYQVEIRDVELFVSQVKDSYKNQAVE